MFSIQSAKPNRLLLRGILSVILGVVVVSVPDISIEVVMRVLGTLLVLDGIVAFTLSYFGKIKPKGIYSVVPRGTSNLIVGIVLLLFPNLLVNIFVFVIGLILLLAGISQLSNQLGGRSKIGFSWLLTIISIIAVGAGALLLGKPFESKDAILIFFGIIIALYGSGEIVWSFKVRKIQKQNKQTNNEIIDADYEEVQ